MSREQNPAAVAMPHNVGLAILATRLQGCGGLFSRWRIAGREEAPGLMSPQMPSARRGPLGLTGPNQRKRGACWGPSIGLGKNTPPQPPRAVGGWEPQMPSSGRRLRRLCHTPRDACYPTYIRGRAAGSPLPQAVLPGEKLANSSARSVDYINSTSWACQEHNTRYCDAMSRGGEIVFRRCPTTSCGV
jgi:hypothetical protein